jgi:hypothetical protein
MKFQQISQWAKEYLKTAETLLRAAQTMADRAIADQLRALAEDNQHRAEKACMLIRPKCSLDRRLMLETTSGHDLMDSITAQPVVEPR